MKPPERRVTDNLWLEIVSLEKLLQKTPDDEELLTVLKATREKYASLRLDESLVEPELWV